MQTVGETTEAILKDSKDRLNEIIHENRDRVDPYWVVIAAKPSRVRDEYGRLCILQHFKAHYTKPRPLVGAIIAEVDNRNGKIKWQVNPPDVPFAYGALGLTEDGAQEIETAIPQAYLYN